MNRPNATLNHIYSTQASNQTASNIYSAANVQSQQQSDSPAHRIYRQRSSKTFSQMMRPEEDVYSVNVGKLATATTTTTTLPDYLQEHQQPPRVSPSTHLLPLDQQMQPQQQGIGYDSAWLDRQERVLRDIERRLERLEEQQHRRQQQQQAPDAQSGGLAVAAVTNESFLRLLDQMQVQQRQMQRMQEQMDELRRAMEQSLQQQQREETVSVKGKRKQEEEQQLEQEEKRYPSAAKVGNNTSRNSESSSNSNSASAPQQQNMLFWLGAALIVTFLFAIVAVLIAVIAVARSNKPPLNAVSTSPVPPNYAYDLSSSMPLSTRSYASSPAWNSANTAASGSMRTRSDEYQDQDTRLWSPESMRGGGGGAGGSTTRVPMSFLPRNHVLFSP